MGTKNYGKDGSGKVRTAAGDKDGSWLGDKVYKVVGAVKNKASEYSSEQGVVDAGSQAGATKEEKMAAQIIKDKRLYRK